MGIGQLRFQQARTADRYRFGIVYSETEWADSHREELALAPAFAEFVHQNRIETEFYFDSRLDTATAIKLNRFPSIVVIDEQGVLQYVQAVEDANWPTELGAALDRIERGESIAQEMLAEYDRYLTEYEQQLAVVDARPVPLGKGESNGRTKARG